MVRSRIVDILPRRPPDPSKLPPTLLARCVLIDRQLPALRPPTPDGLLAWAGLRLPIDPQEVPATLTHLRFMQSERVVATAQSFGDRWGRSVLERAVADVARPLAQSVGQQSPAAFIRALEDTVGAALRGPMRLRTGPVGTRPDRKGMVLRFAPAGQLHAHLDVLRQWLQTHASASVVVRAAVACHFLATCHPFDDGNGRTARLAANAMLAHGGMPTGHYLPLHELFVLSLGGMETRSRLVEIAGAWSPWIAWFADLVELALRIQVDLTAN